MEIRKPDYNQLNLLIEDFNKEWEDASFCDIDMFTDFLNRHKDNPELWLFVQLYCKDDVWFFFEVCCENSELITECFKISKRVDFNAETVCWEVALE